MFLQTRIKLYSTTRLSKYKYIGTIEINRNQQVTTDEVSAGERSRPPSMVAETVSVLGAVQVSCRTVLIRKGSV